MRMTAQGAYLRAATGGVASRHSVPPAEDQPLSRARPHSTYLPVRAATAGLIFVALTGCDGYARRAWTEDFERTGRAQPNGTVTCEVMNPGHPRQLLKCQKNVRPEREYLGTCRLGEVCPEGDEPENMITVPVR